MICRNSKLRWHTYLAMVLSVLATGLPTSLARAQACALSPTPVFAGHTLPLDSDPVPQQMKLERAFTGLDFSSLVGLYAAPDSSDRIFVVERNGRIFVFENRNDVTTATLFLDIVSLVQSSGGEQGLLGLAFDPSYATNRRFFVNYTAT